MLCNRIHALHVRANSTLPARSHDSALAVAIRPSHVPWLDGGITCSGLDFAVEMKNWSRRSSETCESLISDSGDRRATIKMRYHHYHHFQPDAISGGIGLPHRTTPFSPPLPSAKCHPTSPLTHIPPRLHACSQPQTPLPRKGLGDTFTPLRVWLL
ncbi:hypothetical protein BGZ61DRAFT_113158 [Ilyonectria robusta]|uniref:uncharacterized protein n=1 Tax=Ilyonectria robusta TaxID=1079257 RepID=UPI001E8CAD5B|nr:uncharacterized protein BGZ61DRAFT_113158 [Ilyonectria robusta]KAH8669985.1 hypothetical protein BGZ61DRAFT_113158 [Ilyonectria robusta]